MGSKQYVFDAAHETERDRLDTMTAFFEPGTRRLVEALGCTSGWRVLEVGGGTGTTTRWLCDLVGVAGTVVATDLDPRFLDEVERDNLEVRKHNIVSDEIEDGTYDLVHARLLLEWLPDKDHALRQMVRALKPGGWILAEDYNFVTFGSWQPEYELGNKVRDAISAVFEGVSGFDVETGLKLPGMLTRAGLVDVQAEGRCDVAQGGSRGMATVPLTLKQLRPFIEAGGLMTGEEIDQAINDAKTRVDLWGFTPLMVAAWGRKPD